jgi:hypothetical protein
MDAQHIFDIAPLGAVIAFSDGTPKPPARFTKKLSSWENYNGSGRLTVKTDAAQIGSHHHAAGFALHLATYSSHGVTILTVTRHYNVNSALDFEIIEYPRPGMVRVLKCFGTSIELLHLAANAEAAEQWLQAHPYTNATLEGVVADEQMDDAINATLPILGRAA